MSTTLSQIVAELLARTMEGKDSSSQVQLLSDEVRKAIQRDDTLYGKFHGILDSFRTIIPDEQQRYLAALQALSTTSKLSRQEIMQAINGQLEELKIAEQGLTPFLTSWRDTLKAMEARQSAIKNELAQLHERIAQLENEDKALLAMKATREQNLAQAEKTIRDIFANIGAEISVINRKMAELPAEAPTAQPAGPTAPAKSVVPGEKTGGGEQKVEITAPPAPEDTKFQKKCPMCGGRFNLLELQNLWQCFTCGYEEPAAGAAQSASDPTNASTPAPAPEPAASQAPSFIEPVASMLNEYGGAEKDSSHVESRTGIRKKTCPGCGKKMFWYPDEKAWRCPNCHYERRI